MKKIRIFLGGYINFINAQNLNCRALTQHLDKERFKVGAMTLYSGSLSLPNIEGLRLFHVGYPYRFTKYIAFLRGILWADVVYLPKGEICGWNKFWIKALKKKSFRTVEGIFPDYVIAEIEAHGMSYEDFLASFRGYDRLFSITKFVKDYNEKNHGIVTDDKILYLGSDIEIFLNRHKKIEKLHHIVFIGRLKKRKGIYDVLKIAETFPNLNFSIVGNGEEEEILKLAIAKKNLRNVELLGTLTHEELASKLKNMDLHLFPSRSEGFPKVTLETAAAGVPSLVYDDYGADEWITHGKNGYVVHTLEEMIETIRRLEKNPEELDRVSKNAVEMARRFDWKVVVKDWEEVIERLYNEK